MPVSMTVEFVSFSDVSGTGSAARGGEEGANALIVLAVIVGIQRRQIARERTLLPAQRDHGSPIASGVITRQD